MRMQQTLSTGLDGQESLDHLSEDVLPPLLDRQSSEAE